MAVLALVSGTVAGLWVARDDEAPSETPRMAEARVAPEATPARTIEPSGSSELVVGETANGGGAAKPVEPSQPEPTQPEPSAPDR